MERPFRNLYLPKLFGGPSHGKRVAVEPSQRLIVMPRLEATVGYQTDLYTDTGGHQTNSYIQRKAVVGNNLVCFYAISTANDKRAFEMLCNYMLRGAIAV